jgi:5'-nucleotidase
VRSAECWLTDMDGVLVREEHALPGAAEFLARLVEKDRRFLVLTNNSIFTPRDLAARLVKSGLHIAEESIWTSALHEVGYTLTDRDPDFVVLGETRTYSFEAITRAIRLIEGGARFIATNPDVTGPSEEGPLPATGSVAAMITKATGRDPYFVGKPNPMMLRSALNKIEAHSENTVLVGDRMDTDIVAGIEAGLETILVLTGSTRVADIARFPWRPSRVLDSIADAIELV